MSEPSADEIFKRFSRQAKQLETLTAKAQAQQKKRNLSQLSTDALFSSALLSLHLRFELFLEDLFYSCITESSGIADCVPEIAFSTRTQAQRIFFGHLDYPVWMPYEKGAEKLGKRAFVNGGPFSRLKRQADERRFLEDFTAVRNAIAHQSDSSLKKVAHLTASMRARRRTPAGFLQHSVQGDTQFNNYTSSVLVIASALSRSDISAAKAVLSPETDYLKSDLAPGGKYQCVTCGKYKTLRSKWGKIGDCTRCKGMKIKQKTWRRVY